MSYQPKAGDKVRITPRVIETVVNIPTSVDIIDYNMVSYPFSKYDVELIEAAPVPFEVGKPLTKEMGEPPIGSSVTYLTGGKQLRYTDTWIHTATGWRDGDGSMMEWQYFAAAISGGVLVLDRLGVGQ